MAIVLSRNGDNKSYRCASVEEVEDVEEAGEVEEEEEEADEADDVIEEYSNAYKTCTLCCNAFVARHALKSSNTTFKKLDVIDA